MKKILYLILLPIILLLPLTLLVLVMMGIDSLNLENGLSNAFWAYFHFGIIWIIPFIVNHLIITIRVKRNKAISKKEILFYYICGVFTAFIIAVFFGKYNFDSEVFIFFTLVPAIFYGIYKGLEEESKMTVDEKTKFKENLDDK